MRLWVAIATALSVALGSVAARAQDCPRCTDVGEAPDALPGLRDVPVAELRPALSGAVSLSGGWGFSSGEPWAGSSRHRLEGAVAGAIHVLPWLAIGAQMAGRWETVDRGNATGSDSGLVGLPTLTARLTMEPIESLGLALDVATWMYGGEAPSLEPASTSLRARLVGSYGARLDGALLTISATAGGLLDNSRAAAPRAITDRLSDADRLSIGVSDFSGALVGLGAALRISDVEVLLEGTYRILIGDGAPGAGAMPLHVVAGARWRPLGELLELGAYADLRASEAREDLVAPGRPAAPLDPFFTLTLQATVRLGVDGRPSPAVADDDGGGQGDDAAAGEGATLSGRVTDETGAPVAGATIELVASSAAEGAEPLRATTDADGRWSIAGVPAGPARVVIRIDGREPIERAVEVAAGGTLEVPLSLGTGSVETALPRGEIRGVVQGHDGAPLAARIRIQPVGIELICDADGAFEAEVPPGRYEVVINAPGHRPQTRQVEVEERGVILLNAQLHRGR